MSTDEQNAANAAREFALNRAPLGQAEFRKAFAFAGARDDAARPWYFTRTPTDRQQASRADLNFKAYMTACYPGVPYAYTTARVSRREAEERKRAAAAVDADESDADSVDAADSGAIKNPPPPPPVKPVEDSDFDAGSLLGNTPVHTPTQTPHQTPMHSPATSAFSMQFAVPHWTPTSGWTLPPPAPQSAPASFASLKY